jgi:hypothetical protein
MDAAHAVTGQAHIDPWHHGALSTNWQYDRARSRVNTAWQNVGYLSSNLFIGNGGIHVSSNGELGKVHH